MRLSSDEVAQFLKDHPEFFDEYAEMLAEIYVPHPHGGRAIPIAERQIVTLRDKAHALEHKLRELIQFGRENDTTIERLHQMSMTLMSARSVDDLLAGLYAHLRADFSVPQVALRLWASNGDERHEFQPVSAEVRVFADSLSEPYFSAAPMFETLQWFGAAEGELKSFGYAVLRGDRTLGLLALGSDDPARFRPEMGSLYVKRLADLAGAALGRFVDAG
ncbi:MAG: DUF484 family protein [Burkholderiales bacterium]